MKKGTAIKPSKEDRIFYGFVLVIVTLIFLTVLYPIIYVISASFSSPTAVSTGKVVLWPVEFGLDGYKAVFENKDVLIGYRNTLFYTVFGTLINVFATLFAAYPLSRSDFAGRRYFLFFFTFTMLFSGGMVPSFLLIRSLGLMNTRWSVVLSCLMSTYYAVLVTNFIRSLPVSLLESARLDGASETTILLRIVLPLSKPIIATIALFYTVDKWNEWWNSMLYINRTEMYPLQLILQNIINTYQSAEQRNIASADALTHLKTFSMGIKMAAIVVTMLPIMCVFPFLQRFFVKGVMIGSVKG